MKTPNGLATSQWHTFKCIKPVYGKKIRFITTTSQYVALSGLEVYTAGNNMQTYKTLSSPNQIYNFEDGRIHNYGNDWALDTIDKDDKEGHPVFLAPYKRSDTQKWTIVYLEAKKDSTKKHSGSTDTASKDTVTHLKKEVDMLK